MTNYCYYSKRFVNLLSFRWTYCQNLCRACRHKQNYTKSGFIYRAFQTEVKKTYNYLPPTVFRNNLKSLQWRNNFSTTTERVQRLNQIHRNGAKEKTPSNEPVSEWQQLSQLSLFQKFKVMFKKYWYISIPVHCVTSGLWFGLLYLVAQSGFDVKPLLDTIKPYVSRIPLPEFIKKPLTSDTHSESVGYVAIALVMYKLVTPARYATTVGTSFYAIKYFVKRGLIKPAPTGQQIKARVIRSRAHLNQVLRERLEKKDQLRKLETKARKKPKI